MISSKRVRSKLIVEIRVLSWSKKHRLFYTNSLIQRPRRVWLNTYDSTATRRGSFWSVVWRRAQVSSKLQEFAASTLSSIDPTSQLPFVKPLAFSQQIMAKSKWFIPHLNRRIRKSKLPILLRVPFQNGLFFESPTNWGPATGSAASAPSAALGFSGGLSSSATSCTFKTDEPKGRRDCEEISERKQMGNQRQKHVKTIQIETIIIKSELW